jgi:hypothetical protein
MKNTQKQAEESGNKKSGNNNKLIQTLSKSAMALLAAGTMAVIGVQTAQAQGNGALQFSAPTSTTVSDPCTGEDVDINGTITLVSHVFFNNGVLHIDAHVEVSGLGVGKNSGTVYIFDQTFTSITKMVPPFTTLERSIPTNVELVSKGGSPNQVGHGIVHLTVNANGVVTASFVISSVSCK